jgi:type 1 fimbriae regulatory protein FimB
MSAKRNHLTSAEVTHLVAATTGSRYEIRDRCLMLLMSRHGLRVSEAIRLTVADVDMQARSL